ncbi:MAG: ABC-F family ATP-binding cassette domain-containing protein [Bacteroidetes bacterium]|nr:ABC-F family ATP-binding cassette domain-containing protein [Bacteroidota bacterium]
MNYLTVENISKSYGEHPLFTDVSLSLQENQKTALIAANGSGKSTILRIIAGKETADSGNVVSRNGLVIGYLPQDPLLELHLSVKENIFIGDNAVMTGIGEYEKLLEQTEYERAPDYDKQLEAAVAFIDNNKAWDYEAKVSGILGKLNIHDLSVPVKQLSGGQRKRIALAKLLIEEPDILLMDEPTNHLDLDMIEWLENYLKRLNKTLLMVTHDRYFLDSACDTILELDNGKMYSYKGNYAYFLEKKSERIQMHASEMEKVKNLYVRELDWMRRQPKARTTKQKARIDSFGETEEKLLSNKVETKMQITMQMSRMGSKILEFENICKKYGENVLLNNFSYTFKRGEKIGIVGKNGAGKSTLLKMIMGEITPDAGRIKTGDTVTFGYYSQDGMQFKEDQRVIEVAREITDYVDTGNGTYMNIAQFLQHFKFDFSKQHSHVSKLSGGEKRRLYLLTILIRNPNFLILDEPTNDLDIVTLNLLEDFLLGYEGCVLLVTHDRYFMDKLVDHVFVFRGNGEIKDIHGNYTTYRNLIDNTPNVIAPKSAVTNAYEALPKAETKKKKGLTFKQKHELELLEKAISDLENDKKNLLTKLNDPNIDHEKLFHTSKLYEITEKHLEEKTLRWMELSELQES